MKTQRTRLEASKTDAAVLPLHLIVLTQNSADYIENYLRHLATQCTQLDAENYTITVIDQNSSDRTLALVELTSRDLTGIHVAYSPADSIQTTLRSIPVQPKSSVVLLSPESPKPPRSTTTACGKRSYSASSPSCSPKNATISLPSQYQLIPIRHA